MTERKVFVLGAGFTKSFVPSAPLLVDDYRIVDLLERFRGLPHAVTVLRGALGDSTSQRVDLEALLTRLSGMPYDSREAEREFAVLELALRGKLLARIKEAKDGEVARLPLKRFARFLLESRASVVTFNYDDVLDEALWDVHRHTGPPSLAPSSYWHPDGGYGFYCRPSSVCVAERLMFMDQPSTLMLKLHGSMNWRSRLGESSARGPSALLHHEAWLSHSTSLGADLPDYSLDQIEKFLEPEPLIVPRCTSNLACRCILFLRVVWEAAHDVLSAARQVVFVGYSMPETDLAARTLFREALGGRDVELHVVDCREDASSQARLREAYRKVVTIPDEGFYFSGARSRIARDFSRDDASDAAGHP